MTEIIVGSCVHYMCALHVCITCVHYICIICKVTWGNSVKMTSDSDSYNFASTLAIEMYLGKHDAYSILNTTQVR